MSTYKQLLLSDLIESRSRYKKYWKSSSLKFRERMKNKPISKKCRRDRVMIRICKTQMLTAMKNCDEAFKAYISNQKVE